MTKLADALEVHVAALLVDAMCFQLLTFEVPFRVFLCVRFVEGCAHIAALSLLLAIAAKTAEAAGSGKIMGMVGAGITLGVAIGAPIGGRIGREDPLLPLRLGGVLLLVVAALIVVAMRDNSGHRDRPLCRSHLAHRSARGRRE